jgi:hypothetical protein
MANVADYQVLFDGSFSFGGNESFKTLKFSVPTNMVFTAAAKMILSFKIRSTVDMHLKIEVNHSSVLAANFSQSGLTRSFWTTFSPGIPFPEGSSLGVVDVRFICDTLGTVTMEDVVMWYKVKL